MLPLGRRERGIAGGGRRRLAGRGPGSVRGAVCGLLAWGLVASLLAVVAPVGVTSAGAQSPPAAEVVDVPHDWALIPDGVEAGDEFRLVFVTQERRNATSSNIADYDAFVRTSAGSSSALAALRAYAQHFKALGSTSAVHARDHLGMDPHNGDHQDVPVYWVGGPRAAPSNSVVFRVAGTARSSVGWESVGRYASGTVVPSGTARRVWTGSRDDGTRRGPSAFLGAGSAGWAFAEQTVNHISYGSGVGSPNTNYSLYGMSAVFRAEAAPLVSNLGQSDGQFLSVAPSDRAQAFSTGSNATGYALGGVDVEFTALSDSAVFASKMTAAVWSDSGGAPGALVATLVNPAYQQTTADRVFRFGPPAGGVALAADSTYWLVLDSDGSLQGNHRVRSTASGGEDTGAAAGFSIADDSASRPAASSDGWTSSAESMKLAVNGIVNPPPPPEPETDGSYVVPHDWELVPSGLDSGDEFRLFFVTASRRQALSSDIADYDRFVQ